MHPMETTLVVLSSHSLGLTVFFGGGGGGVLLNISHIGMYPKGMEGTMGEYECSYCFNSK